MGQISYPRCFDLCFFGNKRANRTEYFKYFSKNLAGRLLVKLRCYKRNKTDCFQTNYTVAFCGRKLSKKRPLAYRSWSWDSNKRSTDMKIDTTYQLNYKTFSTPSEGFHCFDSLGIVNWAAIVERLKTFFDCSVAQIANVPCFCQNNCFDCALYLLVNLKERQKRQQKWSASRSEAFLYQMRELREILRKKIISSNNS